MQIISSIKGACACVVTLTHTASHTLLPHTHLSSRSSACMVSSARLSTFSLGRLRLVLGPKVSWNGCVVSRLLRTCACVQ